MIDPGIPRGWPNRLIEIAELIGTGPTLNLIDAYRGRDYCYVPKGVTPDSSLAQIIGPENAAKLSQRWAGEKLFLPELASARHRKRLIAQAEGRTSDVAREFGVSARWVREVRQGARPDSRQMDMFASGEDVDSDE
ncbi:MAG: hypothetical protein E6R08_04030 [Nevskiaceae bacterium]|nr:MAG: hypothetical protein E6R08_04030 [Nevskiaceae bacterium]